MEQLYKAMKQIIIISDNFNNVDEALEYIGVQMDFPEHYGRNLDALYDCLTDVVDPCGFIFVYGRDYSGEWMDELVSVIDAATEENMAIYRYNVLKLGREYKHFKKRNYLVEDIARHSEDYSWYVVYRRLYDDGGLWIRPLPMFLEEVDHIKYPDVEQKYRFELI